MRDLTVENEAMKEKRKINKLYVCLLKKQPLFPAFLADLSQLQQEML